MIVTPDFYTHWKTRLLITSLNDPAAPGYLIQLWAHCQNRKTYRFDSASLTPKTLKAITNAPTDETRLWNALIESGFLDLHEDDTIEAHGFYDQNKQMCANWEIGKKGGRPRKEKPIDNLSETHSEPKEEKGEGREKKEKPDKQDEIGEEEPEIPFSPPPRKSAFWHGKDYSKAEIPEIGGYEDIHRIQDPIVACMAVSGDHSQGMYGFLVKGLQKCLDAGLSAEAVKECLFDLCSRLFGEKKAGERKPGQIAAALVAEMKLFFATA